MTNLRNEYLTSLAAKRLEGFRDEERRAQLDAVVPFEQIISAIDSIAEPSLYHYLPNAVYEALSEVEHTLGPEGLGLYKKFLVVRLIDDMPSKIDGLPSSVLDLYPDTLDMLAEEIAETPNAHYLQTNHQLGPVEIHRELMTAAAR